MPQLKSHRCGPTSLLQYFFDLGQTNDSDRDDLSTYFVALTEIAPLASVEGKKRERRSQRELPHAKTNLVSVKSFLETRQPGAIDLHLLCFTAVIRQDLVNGLGSTAKPLRRVLSRHEQDSSTENHVNGKRRVTVQLDQLYMGWDKYFAVHPNLM